MGTIIKVNCIKLFMMRIVAYLDFLIKFPSFVLCNTNGNRLETTIMLPEDETTSTVMVGCLKQKQ